MVQTFFGGFHAQNGIFQAAGTRPFTFVLLLMFTVPLIAGVRLAFDVHVVDTENGYAMRGTVQWVSTVSELALIVLTMPHLL